MNNIFVKYLFVLGMLVLASPSLLGQTKISKLAFNKALHQYNLENYQASVGHLKTAVESTPDFQEAYRLMANCYDNMNDLENAIDAYKKVLDVNPNQEKVLYNMARLQISNKDYDGAEKSLQTAVNINPDYAKANNKLQKLRAYRSGEEERTSEAVMSKDNNRTEAAPPEKEVFVPPAADWGEDEAPAPTTPDFSGADMTMFWASPDPLDADFSEFRINTKDLTLKLETISTVVLRPEHFILFVNDDFHILKKRRLNLSAPISQGEKHIQSFEYRLNLPKGKHKIRVELSVGDDNLSVQELTVLKE